MHGDHHSTRVSILGSRFLAVYLCTFFIAYTQNDVFSNIMKTLIINALEDHSLLLAKFLEFVISDLGDRIGFDELLIITNCG